MRTAVASRGCGKCGSSLLAYGVCCTGACSGVSRGGDSVSFWWRGGAALPRPLEVPSTLTVRQFLEIHNIGGDNQTGGEYE